MRCPSCNKFVSYDELDPEIQDISVDKEGNVAGEVRIVLPCIECGEELKEAVLPFDVEVDLRHECEEENPGFSIEGESATFTNRLQNTDRHGKPIKSARYMKTFYGAEITGEVVCDDCEERFPFQVEVEEQANSFDELV